MTKKTNLMTYDAVAENAHFDNIKYLDIYKIEMYNTNLINIADMSSVKKIIAYARDLFYDYEIELNENHKIMMIPKTIIEKYKLEEVQEKIDKYFI